MDPNFFRSVVLMCSHSEEGAFGLVLNQPSSVTIADVCAEAEISWSGDDESLALTGGPVEPARGWVLHRPEHAVADSEEITDGLMMASSRDALEAYGRHPDASFRLFLGYSGWGMTQLEGEISGGSWLTAPYDPNVVFNTPPHLVWRAALALVGIDPANLVDGNRRVN